MRVVHLSCQSTILCNTSINTRFVNKHLLIITETVQVSCLRVNSYAEARGRNDLATASELHLVRLVG